MNPIDSALALRFREYVNSRGLLLVLTVLGLGFGIYRFGGGEEAQETAPGDPVASPRGETKTARPDERSLSLDGGAALKVERALEKGSHESALEGFRELILARERNGEEMIELIRRRQGIADIDQEPRFKELDELNRDLEGRINIAQATMLQHDVDPEAIRAIMKEHRERAGRITAIRELSDDLGPPPARR